MTNINNKKLYCYNKSDYVGFLKRWLILVIDAFVLVFIIIFIISILALLGYRIEILVNIAVLSGILIYHILFKYLFSGTIGYKLCDMKLVDCYGKKPSLYSVILRLSIWMMLPGHTIIDLLGFAVSKDGNCLINSYSDTFIVKQDAQPISAKSNKSYIEFNNGIVLIYRVIDSE